ncbi:unnamed protein product, partial [Polarella glacialis]
MRFEAVELELSGCLRPKLLEAQRQEIEEWRGRLEKDLAESVTQLGLELKAGLATKFDATRQSLEKVKDSIAGRVQVCEELLGTGPESTMSTMSDAAAAPKPSGGSGGAGGASIEVRVARIEANMKKAASKPSSAGGGPTAGTDIMVTAAVSRGNSGHLLGVEEAQRLAEEAAERCSVLEVRLEQVSNQVQDLKNSPPSAGVKVVASEARSRSKTSSAEIAMHAEIAASEANAAPAQRQQVLSRDLPTSEAQEAFVMEPPGATSFAAEGLPPDFAEALEARFASLERRLDSPDRDFAELESIVEAEADADVQMEAAPGDAAEAEADAAPKGKSPGLDKLQKDLDKLSKEVKGRLSNLDKNVKKLQGDKPAAPAAAGAQSVVAEVIRVQESFREVSGDAAAAGLALAESYASELLEHGAELQRLSEKVTGLHDAVATLSNQSRTPEVEALPTAAAVAAAEVPAAEAEVPAAAAPSAPSGNNSNNDNNNSSNNNDNDNNSTRNDNNSSPSNNSTNNHNIDDNNTITTTAATTATTTVATSNNTPSGVGTGGSHDVMEDRLAMIERRFDEMAGREQKAREGLKESDRRVKAMESANASAIAERGAGSSSESKWRSWGKWGKWGKWDQVAQVGPNDEDRVEAQPPPLRVMLQQLLRLRRTHSTTHSTMQHTRPMHKPMQRVQPRILVACLAAIQPSPAQRLEEPPVVSLEKGEETRDPRCPGTGSAPSAWTMSSREELSADDAAKPAQRAPAWCQEPQLRAYQPGITFKRPFQVTGSARAAKTFSLRETRRAEGVARGNQRRAPISLAATAGCLPPQA